MWNEHQATEARRERVKAYQRASQARKDPGKYFFMRASECMAEADLNTLWTRVGTTRTGTTQPPLLRRPMSLHTEGQCLTLKPKLPPQLSLSLSLSLSRSASSEKISSSISSKSTTKLCVDLLPASQGTDVELTRVRPDFDAGEDPRDLTLALLQKIAEVQQAKNHKLCRRQLRRQMLRRARWTNGNGSPLWPLSG